MSLKTDLSFEITLHSTAPINLGKAAGTNWSLQTQWVGQKLSTLIIKRSGSSEYHGIDITVIFIGINYHSSHEQCTFYDQHVTTFIEEGQTTTEIKMKVPVPFAYQNDKVRGIITVKKYQEKVVILPNLSGDLLRLLNNPDFFPDAILKCGETEISVHKCILSVRSSVFAAMFKNEMREGISGIATIEDLEPNVLLAMLKYIYSDRTDNLTDVLAGDLLFAADEYQLKELKLICVDKLKSSLTVNNVFRALRLGDLHDSGLKNHAKDFVCKCRAFSELEKTEDWNSLKRNHPDLAIEVLISVVKYKENRNY